MAKRIEFIAPVEAMRGNLSGRQTLEYPTNDNQAYDAPEGKHYATNYQPRYIGAKRASDSLKYFAVRTKNAINKTAASTQAMAVLGGGGAIVGAILRDKTAQIYLACLTQYQIEVSSGVDWKSLREFLSAKVMQALRDKSHMIYISPLVTIGNPYVSGAEVPTFTVEISSKTLVKFWTALADGPFVAKIDGQTMIAHVGDTFGTVASSNYNILGLKILNIDNVNSVCSEDSTTESGSYLTYVVSSIPNVLSDQDPVTIAERYGLTWEKYPE